MVLRFPVVNKETSVKTTVAEDIVDRDLPFAPPKSREQTGRLYVPLLRISIVQLELVHVTFLSDQLLGQVRRRPEIPHCAMSPVGGRCLQSPLTLPLL